MKRTPLLPRLLFLALAAAYCAACSSHYKSSLQAIQNPTPPPYLQRTLDWTSLFDERHTPETLLALPVDRLGATSATLEQNQPWPEAIGAVLILNAGDRERLTRLLEPDALAQTVSDHLSWRDLRLGVALHNPAVLAARQRWRAATSQYSQALYLEDLVAEYRTFTRYLRLDGGKPLHLKSTTFFAPSPSPLALKGELVRAQIDLARLAWEKTLRDTLLQAGQAFFEHQYLERSADSTRENIELIESLVAVIEENYRAGKAPYSNLLSLRNALAQQQYQLLDIESRIKASQAHIASLLDLKNNQTLGPAHPDNLLAPGLDAESLLDRAQSGRQELALARTRAERAEIAIRLGEVMNREPMLLGHARYERGMAPEASEKESLTPFGVKPKPRLSPAYAQSESYLAEMRLNLEAQRSDLKDEERKTEALARELDEKLGDAQRKKTLIEDTILPQDQAIYETTIEDYRAGATDFRDLLDAETALLLARLSLHAVRRDLNLAILALSRLTGRV